jgi:hypothetical protein
MHWQLLLFLYARLRYNGEQETNGKGERDAHDQCESAGKN